MPSRPNGTSSGVGFISAKIPKNGHRVARATKAAIHSVGLPFWTMCIDQLKPHSTGWVRSNRIATTAQGCGRCDTTTPAMTPSGTSHHATAGRTVNGTNSHNATGGYSTSRSRIA